MSAAAIGSSTKKRDRGLARSCLLVAHDRVADIDLRAESDCMFWTSQVRDREQSYLAISQYGFLLLRRML